LLPPTSFRSRDLRGLADEFTDEDVELLGRALGAYIGRARSRRRLTVARDCRHSSERLRNALVTGLVAAGCEVTDLGAVPAPLLYFSAFHLDSDGGAMITGGGRPPEYNGFRFLCGLSSLQGEELEKLRDVLAAREFEVPEGGSVQDYEIVNPYVLEVSDQFRLRKWVRVVVDTGNGTAGPALHSLLEHVRCDKVELFFTPHPGFPNHLPDPDDPANLQSLRTWVKDSRADLGVALDGGGDRLAVLDENGNPVGPAELLALCAREILRRKPQAAFLVDVDVPAVLADFIAQLGGRLLPAEKNQPLPAQLQQNQAELAVSGGGRLFFADRYYGYADALYATLRLIELCDKADAPLSRLLADLPQASHAT
jgi:phosphomannomutase/phosphoglucomutase